MSSRPPLQPRRERARCDDDGGFTILEVVMAIVVITIAMTGLAAFFVNSAKATDVQSQRQTASQVGTDAMEQARALSGVGVYSKRDKTTSDLLWAAGQNASATTLFRGVAPFLTNVTEAYDTASTLAPTSGYTAPLPICLPGSTSASTCLSSGATVTLDSVQFTRNWFIGYCYASVTVNGGACSATNAAGLITYLQVVIDVTWPSNACTNNLCSYVTATRVSPTPDPTFDASQSAPKPRIHNPGDQVFDVGQTVNVPVTVSGGTAPLTWQTVTGLPAGLSFSTTSGSPLFSGTLTAATASPITVTLKVTDAFGYGSTAAVKWTVYPKPTLDNPGAQSTTRNATGVTLSLTEHGGAPALTYSATGLPTNMSIDPTTGVISGTPNTAQTVSTTVKVTDALGFSDSKTFTWTIFPMPTISIPGTFATWVTAEQASPSVPISYTCTNPPCQIALSGAAPGLGLDTSQDSNADQSASTSLTVTAASGTVYLDGQVGAAAVSGTQTTSTQAYPMTIKITDSDSVAASTTSALTARVYPSVYSPGHITVRRTLTYDQTVSVRCSSSCTVAVTGLPTGIGIATAASNSSNSTTSVSTSGTATLHLTGKVSSGATLGTTPVTITVTNTISSTSYSISSVGVWTVTT